MPMSKLWIDWIYSSGVRTDNKEILKSDPEVFISRGFHPKTNYHEQCTQFTRHKICLFSTICNGFKITFVSEIHMVEDDVLFTNQIRKFRQRSRSATILHREDMVQAFSD